MTKITYATNNGSKFDNQDSILIDDVLLNRTSMDRASKKELSKKSFVCAVADGVSSSKHSDLAGKMVLETLKESIDTIPVFSVRKLVYKIQNKLANYAIANRKYGGMASTLAAIYFEDNSAHIFNIGDSRIYLFRDKQFKQLSKDHTQAQRMLDRGEITREEFESSSDIYNMLEGYFVAGELDEDEIPIEYKKMKLEEDDIFLICSDGLSDTVTDQEILQVLEDSNLNQNQKTNKLLDKAVSFQMDNVSLILIEI